MHKHPTLSIIIPAYNEAKYIGTCLKHIQKNSGPEVIEIIVIDNGSTDKTREVAEKYGVKVITEKKRGVSFARQRGYKESRGDIIAFLDADTKMPPHWTDKVLMFFQKDRKIGFVTGPYFYHDLNIWQNIVILFFGPLFYVGSFFFGAMGIGGNFAIRRNVLRDLGGFDTRIEFYGDDTDIAQRASRISRAVFSLRVIMPTSGRRFHGSGIIRTHIVYLTNFIWVSLFKKPYHKGYEKFR